MRMLNMCYKCDSHEPAFISATTVGIEIHLSKTFLTIFVLMESEFSRSFSDNRRAAMGLPVSEGVSGYLYIWVAVYVGRDSLGS